jgi:hypothetical protein
MKDRKRSPLSIRIAFICVMCIGLGVLASAQAQIGGIDISQLLQQFGTLTGQGGITQTPTTPTTTQPTTPGTGTGVRQPTITGETQFNTASGGALGLRRPGIYIQNAMAVQGDTNEFIDGSAVQEPDNFYKSTFDQIALGVIDQFTSLIESLNLLSGLGGLAGTGTGSTGTSTISNPATTGAGTTTTLP